MRAYHDRNKANPAAARYVVSAAYWTTKTKKAAKDPTTNGWWKATIAAFERFKARVGSDKALGSPEAGMAAEGAFTMLDEELRRGFDYESGHHRFKGTPVEVLKKYSEEAVEAKRYYDKLQRIVDDYASPQWATAAIARQGSLYDSLRTGLYDTRPPALVMFDKKTESLLRRAEESDNFELQEQADAVRIKVENAWRDKRDQELDSADRIMVDRYGHAVVLARRYNVSSPAVVRAIQRLAFFTEVIGEAKLAQYAGAVKDLGYSEGLFLRIRPGLVQTSEPVGMAEPLPVLPQ